MSGNEVLTGIPTRRSTKENFLWSEEEEALSHCTTMNPPTSTTEMRNVSGPNRAQEELASRAPLNKSHFIDNVPPSVVQQCSPSEYYCPINAWGSLPLVPGSMPYYNPCAPKFDVWPPTGSFPLRPDFYQQYWHPHMKLPPYWPQQQRGSWGICSPGDMYFNEQQIMSNGEYRKVSFTDAASAQKALPLLEQTNETTDEAECLWKKEDNCGHQHDPYNLNGCALVPINGSPQQYSCTVQGGRLSLSTDNSLPEGGPRWRPTSSVWGNPPKSTVKKTSAGLGCCTW